MAWTERSRVSGRGHTPLHFKIHPPGLFVAPSMAQCNSSHGARSQWRASGVLLLLLACPLALANVTITVKGVSAPLRSNVLAYLSFARYQKSKNLSADTVERLQSRIAAEVQSALKPFGYFQPRVSSNVAPAGPGNWKVSITVHPGPPVILKHVDVRVVGPGATSRLFKRITSHLPFMPASGSNRRSTTASGATSCVLPPPTAISMRR